VCLNMSPINSKLLWLYDFEKILGMGDRRDRRTDGQWQHTGPPSWPLDGAATMALLALHAVCIYSKTV